MEIQNKETAVSAEEYGFKLESDRPCANSIVEYHSVVSMACIREGMDFGQCALRRIKRWAI